MERNPTQIARYELLGELAIGGMGRVYLAQIKSVGGFARKVVLKTLEIPTSAEDPAVAMFLDEARVLGRLHHQHIAGVFDVGRDDDGRLYLVLEYIGGRSAHEVFERAIAYGAALPIDFTLTVVSAAANALHYAHGCKDDDDAPLSIVHRDVTPSNLMIGYDGAVKLIDFGIAKAANRDSKTETGFVKGKVGYLSPEQIAGNAVDGRSDVFALGIVLYELTTLRRAFREVSDLATMQRIKAGKVTPPSQLVADFSPDLESIILKALQVEPVDRFANADEMRRALEALAHRMHLVVGDAAVIEVMAQLFDRPTDSLPGRAAKRTSGPDVLMSSIGQEVLAASRAESVVIEYVSNEEAATRPVPDVPVPPRRKLRAATETAEAQIVASVGLASSRRPDHPTEEVATVVRSGAIRSRTEEVATVLKSSMPVTSTQEPATIVKAEVTSRSSGRVMVAKRLQRPSVHPEAPGTRLRMGRIGAVAALLVAAGLATYVATRTSSAIVADSSAPTSTPAPQPVPPKQPTTPQPLPPVPEPAAPEPPPDVAGPEATTIHLRITTHPADATVVLDGKRLGHTPLDETVDRAPGKHSLKLRRHGYTPQKLDIELAGDVIEDITLTPLP